jgi:hypothetical protein
VPAGSSDIVDPLASLTPDQLWNLQVLLQIACGRSRSVLRRYRRQHFCLLFQNLKLESDLRGLPTPQAPYHIGDVRPDAL